MNLETTSSNRKQRILGYDALKAIAAFLVVLYHLRMVDFGYHDGVYYYPTLTQVLWLVCACGVPLFFMVNGALTVNRNYDLKKTITKSSRLVFIGLFWALVVMGVYTLRDHQLPSIHLNSLAYYWFLFSLALIYLINYILAHLPHWCKAAVVVLLLLYPFTYNLLWDIMKFNNYSAPFTAWRGGFFTLYGLIYLYAGDYLRHVACNKWIPFACALLGFILLSIEVVVVVNYTHIQFEGGNFCFPTFGALLLSVAIFLLVKDWNPSDIKVKKFVTFLGNNALGIYVLHHIMMITVGAFFPIIYDIFVHPLLAIIFALAYTVVAAIVSQLIRQSRLGFLLKL